MGRKKLHIALANIGFRMGTKERVLLLYPNLTFSAAVRKIVDAHLNEAYKGREGEKSYGAEIDQILEAKRLEEEASNQETSA